MSTLKDLLGDKWPMGIKVCRGDGSDDKEFYFEPMFKASGEYRGINNYSAYTNYSNDNKYN